MPVDHVLDDLGRVVRPPDGRETGKRQARLLPVVRGLDVLIAIVVDELVDGFHGNRPPVLCFWGGQSLRSGAVPGPAAARVTRAALLAGRHPPYPPWPCPLPRPCRRRPSSASQRHSASFPAPPGPRAAPWPPACGRPNRAPADTAPARRRRSRRPASARRGSLGLLLLLLLLGPGRGRWLSSEICRASSPVRLGPARRLPPAPPSPTRRPACRSPLTGSGRPPAARSARAPAPATARRSGGPTRRARAPGPASSPCSARRSARTAASARRRCWDRWCTTGRASTSRR